LVLAYIGDCVFDLIVKSKVISQGNRQVHKLHEDTSHFVQASSPSYMMRGIQEHLTDEERGIYHRGRNAKTVSPAKNQSITDYRRATGFEALLGYLYLLGEYQRIMDLLKIGFADLENQGSH
jgi:ribonuclease-3 family protein